MNCQQNELRDHFVLTGPSKETMDFSTVGSGTAAVWAGETEPFTNGAVTQPIVNSVAFGYDDLDEWYSVATGEKPGHISSRNTNPTVRVLEEKIAVLEGAESATAFATGMAAISNTLFALLAPQKRVVSITDSYGGASRLFLDFLPAYGVDVTLCPTTDEATLLAEIARGCDVLYLETPTNPTLKIVDIARLADAAHQVGAVVVVDNTFATPINQKPLTLGADLVVHSATKFLGGHSDAMGGLLCGKKSLVETVFRFREINGASLHPESAYMIARGMKTLELRVERQNRSALLIAQFLQAHPGVADVFYPGLATHVGYAVAQKQMRGFGGVLSFSLKGGWEPVKRVVPALRWAHRAASLGSVSTLVGPPRTTSHVELTPAQRERLGISEGLIRYSVGIENVDDLIADLEQALAKP